MKVVSVVVVTGGCHPHPSPPPPPWPPSGHWPLSCSATAAAVAGVEEAGGGDSMACKMDSSTEACLILSINKNGF